MSVRYALPALLPRLVHACPATRLDDFHTGMAECSGVHTFPVDSSGVDRNFTRYECPRRGKAVESKTAPDSGRTGRGPARQRPVAIWGLPHTNCTASYSVHVAGAWAIVRLPPGYAHNHATNTLPRFVSQQMRSNVETAWRRNGSNADATVVCDGAAAWGRVLLPTLPLRRDARPTT